MPEKMPDRMSDSMPDRVPELVSEYMPAESMSGQPDRMSDRMSDRMMSKYMPKRMSDIVRYCQIERQNKYAMYIYRDTQRWCVRNHVSIVVQGGDHLKKINKAYFVLT